MATSPTIRDDAAAKRRKRRSQPFFLLLGRDEARRMGLTRYYLGRPCNHGHLSERMVSDSHCIECKRVKARLRPPPSSQNEVRRERYGEYQSRYHQRNREIRVERIVKRARERRDTEPAFRLRHNIRRRIAHALDRQRVDKSGATTALLGCTGEHARSHIEAQFAPGMSWENWGDWHVDHIKPLAAFDLSDPAQLAAACHYSNLQPLWAIDNMSKGAKVHA